MIRLDNRAGELLLDLTHAIEREAANLPAPFNEFDWARLRQSIREQLNTPEHAVDLVDTISSHLLHRGNRSGIVGDNLRRFQQALLMPSELSKLRALGTDTISCRSCGRAPSYMEMLTMTPSGEIVCSLCDMPTYLVAQNTCAGHRDLAARIEIPVKALRAIRLAAKQSQDPKGCPHCAAESAAQVEVVPQPEGEPAAVGPLTFSWNRLQGGIGREPTRVRVPDESAQTFSTGVAGARIQWTEASEQRERSMLNIRQEGQWIPAPADPLPVWTDEPTVTETISAPMAEIVRDDAPNDPEAGLSAELSALLDAERATNQRLWSQRQPENPPPAPTQRARPAGPRTRPEGPNPGREVE